jgi:DNA-binding MarR family transcriptional regulator
VVRDSVGSVGADTDLIEAAATSVRRGVTSLGRRLRLERGSGPTVLELSVLGHLHRRGPLSPGELAIAERVQPQTLTRTLADLQTVGLLDRRADPQDGRRALLFITDAGRATLRDDMQRRDAWLSAAMSRELTATEREVLRLAGDLLDKLATADPGI